MLVLSRQRDETIMIGDEVEVTIVDIRGDKVRLGITAPKEISVHRKEVYEAIKRENRAAAQVRPEDLDAGGGGSSRLMGGPRLAGREGGAGGDPTKPVLRPTIRAASPQSLRPQKTDRNTPPRPPQARPGHETGGQQSNPSPPPAGGPDRTGDGG